MQPDMGDPDVVVPAQDRCATPEEGCDCETEGEVVDCGRTAEKFDDYVTCAEGKRTCTDGKWGACSSDRIVQKVLPSRETEGGPGSSWAALGEATVCPKGFNLCDPTCHQLVDQAGGFEVGSGLTNSPTGLKPSKAPRTGCSGLSITASSSTVTVSQIEPLVAPEVTLSAVLTPACVATPFSTTWTIDRFDIGSISGSKSNNGVFTVERPIVGDVKVTAHAQGLSASTTIRVIVRATETSNVSPNEKAKSSQITSFGSSTLSNHSVTWLYPYEDTYFPLGLPAPVVQYRASSGSSKTDGGAVKLSLRYPKGSSLSDSTFNYSLIVAESNTVSVSAGQARDLSKPQIQIPQAAWRAFEQTARGNDADLIIQRVRNNDTTLETESTRTIHLVNGQLKGTVFYNSYSSQLSSYNTGAVLKIAPGAAAPTLAVQPNGKCTVCHSVNKDGTRLIAGGGDGTTITFNKSRRYDVTKPGPSPTVLNRYEASGSDVENVQGNKFTFGGAWRDGSLYMTHGGNADSNWRSPPDYSRLYDPGAPGTAISVSGWSNISAVTPRFSPDGTKLAFGFWGGSGKTLAQSPSGTLSADTSGKSLVVVDFGCSTANCTGDSTGWKVSNARLLTPGVTHKVGWPTFTPNGDAVIYQRQYRSAKNYLSWSPSDINTVAGALAELWISAVPVNKSTTVVPTRLRALNGLKPNDTSYLPTSPSGNPYHVANGAFKINQADSCGVSKDITGVNDYQLNYLPAMAPTAAGGYNWVVFTSRRMYGNIADDDPWDAEPGPKACNGSPCSCSSGVPPAKKLWVAAIDTDFTPGTDPSHPAFYLPGQELKAGNSDGYWVNAQCVDVGQACSSNDDCCGGTGANPTARCDAKTDTCQAISMCHSSGDTCSETSDCCSGLICTGTGTCGNPEFFNTGTYQREYVAECPEQTRPVWRLFEWQATVPTGTTIDIKVQTKLKKTDTYQPTSPLAAGQIVQTTPAGAWAHGTQTVDQVLGAAGLISTKYLLVSLTFNPDPSGETAPSLSNWRQNYSCEDSE